MTDESFIPDVDADTRARALADLEAEAARRRALDARASDPRRAPRLAGADVDQLLARLRARAHATGGTDVPDSDADLDLRERQARARAQSWRASLADAHLTRDAAITLDMLDADKHPVALRRYVDGLADPDGPVRTLILAGTIGAGKTTAAIAVGNTAVAAGISARFVKHSTYLRWLRPDSQPAGMTATAVRDRFARAQLLILDDLGAELDQHATTFVRQETSDLLGDRLGDGLPTVVTTNLASADLAESLGERLVSRLGARALALRVIGPDRRKPVTWG